MKHLDARHHYIKGQWQSSSANNFQPIINPATEEEIGQVILGTAADAELAIMAAHQAFESFCATSLDDRIALLETINKGLIERSEEIGHAISQEMGAPLALGKGAQAGSGPQHFSAIIEILKDFAFEQPMGTTLLRHEPIGVCTLITPWNWPMNQIATKVAPAIAAGCTMILKPSEYAPLDAMILADIIDKAGAPAGVFNLVHGDGIGVGNTLVTHDLVDMVSFTGSTRAGVAISKAAAPTIKRVALELGGKSAAIILDDADLGNAIKDSVTGVLLNSGQSCNAATRVLVPRGLYTEAAQHAVTIADSMTSGLTNGIGPVANAAQYGRVIEYIKIGISEGATLLTGGTERPHNYPKGYFVEPTIFGDVTSDMVVAKEEIFGPVLCLMPYDRIEDAIRIANDSPYGLSGAVYSGSHDAARDVAKKLRTGMVHINGAGLDSQAPFGGYKMSGNGREWGVYGLHEFLEVKSIYGGCSG